MHSFLYCLPRYLVLPLCLLAGLSKPACGGDLLYPVAVVAAPDGAIYVADRKLPGIWKINQGEVEVFVAGEKKIGGYLNAIRCLTLDPDGNLLAGDSATREIYRIGTDKKSTPLTSGGIGIPMDIAVTAAGDLLVSDLELHCIWHVAKDGGKPTKHVSLAGPSGITIDSKQKVWVVSRSTNPLQTIKDDGTLETVIPKRPFQFPQDVAVDPSGTAFVSDSYQKCIWKISPGKAPETWVTGGSLQNPVGLTWAGKDLLVADPRARDVFRISPDGQGITSLTGQKTSAKTP